MTSGGSTVTSNWLQSCRHDVGLQRSGGDSSSTGLGLLAARTEEVPPPETGTYDTKDKETPPTTTSSGDFTGNGGDCSSLGQFKSTPDETNSCLPPFATLIYALRDGGGSSSGGVDYSSEVPRVRMANYLLPSPSSTTARAIETGNDVVDPLTSLMYSRSPVYFGGGGSRQAEQAQTVAAEDAGLMCSNGHNFAQENYYSVGSRALTFESRFVCDDLLCPVITTANTDDALDMSTEDARNKLDETNDHQQQEANYLPDVHREEKLFSQYVEHSSSAMDPVWMADLNFSTMAATTSLDDFMPLGSVAQMQEEMLEQIGSEDQSIVGYGWRGMDESITGLRHHNIVPMFIWDDYSVIPSCLSVHVDERWTDCASPLNQSEGILYAADLSVRSAVGII